MLSLSADARILASAGPSGVSFWDTRSYARQRGLDTAPDGAQKSIDLSPDASTLASGSDNGDIVIWDVQRRDRKFKLESHTQALTGVAVSPDGKTIATSSADGAARLWDRTGKTIRTLKFDEARGGAMIRGLAFAPDGKTIALAHLWEGITLWDPENGQLKQRFEPKAANGLGMRMSALTFSPDGKYLAWDALEVPAPGTMRWDLQKNKEARVFAPGSQSGLSVAISSDGQFIASACGTVSVWRVETGAELFTTRDNETSVAFSPAGLLLAKENFRWATVVDTLTGETLCQFDRSQHDHDSHSLAFSPDGRLLAIADGDDVRVWEIATRRLHTLKGHRGKVNSLAFLPDGKALVSASADCSALVWDLTTVLVPEKAPGLAVHWADLKAAERLPAYAAFCRLLANPEDAITLLKMELTPTAKVNGELEGRRRLWAIKLLEHFGTPPARELLQALARSAADAPSQREAQAALTRLDRRVRLEK